MIAHHHTYPHHWFRVIAIASLAITLTVVAKPALAKSFHDVDEDRLWLINTRGITSNACWADIDHPALTISRLECNGDSRQVTLDEYLGSISPDRSVVIYVHGNRIEPCEARSRGMWIYRKCRGCRNSGPIDWVNWSWPSAQAGILTHDVRRKAQRTDTQGLYLAWLLREQNARSVPTTLIGYSFGGRVVTGALHAMAGGSLGGRSLAEPGVSGASFGAGLIAPAIDSHWLSQHGYHSLATQNMQRLVLLYNHRDVILKRYWLVDRVRGRMALGYSGPTLFGPRLDGSPLPIRSRDCSPSLGIAHNELDYFIKGCRAGSEMARLIDDIQLSR